MVVMIVLGYCDGKHSISGGEGYLILFAWFGMGYT